MDAASRKFAELEKREERLGEREAAAEQAEAAAAERGGELQEREAAAGVREASVAGAPVLEFSREAVLAGTLTALLSFLGWVVPLGRRPAPVKGAHFGTWLCRGLRPQRAR